jgi:hypothetical protein
MPNRTRTFWETAKWPAISVLGAVGVLFLLLLVELLILHLPLSTR